ncbi:TIM barrel protein [uncultured Cyclobacterium sp.]|uniref:hydroxypyruvate isomerase family protein n=1 Tax=uncultured Cyclobacterium sp. TaxID=453820 RepID=UPI0030EED8E7|tara:strand:- start:16556 stop:17470 length:915 start_codon:yes stop_codon:yes gene_type:complete
MKRRIFFKNSLVAGAATFAGLSLPLGREAVAKASPFNMKFSPDFGLFAEIAGKAPENQIRWGHDNGFHAWECTFLQRRPLEEQKRISDTLQKLGMEFGQFVGTMDFKQVTFAGRNESIRDNVLKEVKASVEVAKRMNTKFIHNVLGMADPKLPWDFQLANATELLKRIAEIYEPHGLVMVMETMNHKINHPGMFLHSLPQSYAMAKAVDSPSVKLLCDVYHVQIQEGNLMPSIDYAWDQIAYFQIGDTPGRFEPMSGEINYKNLLQHIWDKGYRGFLGLEHGSSKPGKAGELAVLEAYKQVDPS